jgi:cytochrome P450
MSYPEDVYVGVSNFTLFRNPDYFDEPHAYRPERWIVEPFAPGTNDKEEAEAERKVKRAQSVFRPFSLGPRHCIAQKLALKEVSYVLAKLIYLFDFRIVGDSGQVSRGVLPGVGENIVMEQIDVFTSLERGPVMEWRLREGVVMS